MRTGGTGIAKRRMVIVKRLTRRKVMRKRMWTNQRKKPVETMRSPL